jgi:hypothetical protein
LQIASKFDKVKKLQIVDGLLVEAGTKQEKARQQLANLIEVW